MTGGPGEPVESPHDDGVAGVRLMEKVGQLGPSVAAPEAFSVQISWQPASVSWCSCPSRFCAARDTRAHPRGDPTTQGPAERPATCRRSSPGAPVPYSGWLTSPATGRSPEPDDVLAGS